MKLLIPWKIRSVKLFWSLLEKPKIEIQWSLKKYQTIVSCFII